MSQTIAIVYREQDPLSRQDNVIWALNMLEEVLKNKGLSTVTTASEENGKTAAPSFTIRIGGPDSAAHHPQVPLKKQPESFVLAQDNSGNTNGIWAVGSDARGLMYAILELADRIEHGENPLQVLDQIQTESFTPANEIRSVMRLFVNETDDKPWFYHEDFWREYLTELAVNRFNRFNLALGITYDLGHNPDIKDFYFGFAYPYFVDVPGYNVRVEGLTEEEKEKNLRMLRWIGQEAKRRGLEFQLGIWSHAYEPEESPHLKHKVTGLNRDNHAEYCRDGLKTLLQQCPEIDGITLRTHYESGIPEPAHLFWKVVLKGAAECGRPIRLDMHPKGLDHELLQVAEENGVPFDISPKFWAEHMGLPYHQASIRQTELPVEPHPEAGTMIITTTSRRFTRYGYADFYHEKRPYGIFFRIWPGTQRVLLWGDPEFAAAYGEAGSFLGSKGIELFEPLSFKSRKMSETKYGRDPYKDPTLRYPETEEWKKYKYSYRLWGRLLYHPKADPDEWQRYLKKEFGEAAQPLEKALASASKVLPFVTVVHNPSAANNNYWTEMYYNMPIVDTGKPSREYGFDCPPPHIFNAASSLDPVLFYNINAFVDDLLENRLSGKMTPLEAAMRLDQMADDAEQHLKTAKSMSSDPSKAEFRRWEIDILAQIGLARFFAAKFRAGIAYGLFERLRDEEWLNEALDHYRSAKAHWEQIVAVTENTYAEDLTYGFVHFMRGHWSDRLQAIEEDIANMESERAKADPSSSREKSAEARQRLAESVQKPDLASVIRHDAPKSFERGRDLQIGLSCTNQDAQIQLYYRHAHQAEEYQTVNMDQKGTAFHATIPASYTDSDYPLIYFFEVEIGGKKSLYPGFEAHLANQPYYAVRASK